MTKDPNVGSVENILTTKPVCEYCSVEVSYASQLLGFTAFFHDLI